LKRKSRAEKKQLSSNTNNNSRDIIIIIIDLNYQVTQMLSLYLCYNCLFSLIWLQKILTVE
jgi:hypothetical protein